MMIEKEYFDMVETSIRRLDRTLLDLKSILREQERNEQAPVWSILKPQLDEILHSLKHLPTYDQLISEIKIDQDVEIYHR